MIFCVEDDAGIRNMMLYTLRASGFEVAGFPDGDSFFAALAATTPKLVLLDVMLPGDDGLTILHRLRGNALSRHIPVIMASARGSEFDKITGLDSGADDYLVKPFSMMELVSRVRAVLRRSEHIEAAPCLRYLDLQLDSSTYTITQNGLPVTLTHKEFELLRALLGHPGKVFTRDFLLSKIWGYSSTGETRTIDVHIRTLRQKLGPCGDYIETIRGVGYRIGGGAP